MRFAVFLFFKYAFPIFQMRLSVTVMPHADAASSVFNQRHLVFLLFSGCRIGVRHDGYREPHF
jgi:hypothetical protein